MVHAALRRLGPLIGGPDTVISALLDAVGPQGTLLAYADWQGQEDIDTGFPREHIPPFDPLASRAHRGNGAFPELLRTTPGALRSGNPGASVVALGAKGGWFTSNHPLDYGYGPHSPLAKLVADGGKVLMLGAPFDTITLLHHAEHLAEIAHRITRYEAPLLVEGKPMWRIFEEYDTSRAPEGLAEDYFAEIVQAFLAGGRGHRGYVASASSIVVPADEIVPFAVEWIERHVRTDQIASPPYLSAR